MMLSDSVVTGLTAAGAMLAAVAAFGWKARDWLQVKFDNIKEGQSESRRQFHELIDKHEAKDDERHDQNLERFRKLQIGLARLGSKDGSED